MYKIILFLAVLVLTSCGKISDKNKQTTGTDSTDNKKLKKEEPTGLDKPGYVYNKHKITSYKLQDDETTFETPANMESVFGKGYKSWVPDVVDIGNAEDMINKCFDDQRMGTVDRVLDRKPSDYCKQFIGAINQDGDKILWVNMFCKKELEHFVKWRTDVIFVADGGNCFVQIKFNWTKNNGQYEMKVNGDA